MIVVRHGRQFVTAVTAKGAWMRDQCSHAAGTSIPLMGKRGALHMHKCSWRGRVIRAFAGFGLASLAWASPAGAEVTIQHLSVGGLDREYIISALPAAHPRPTVIVLHGTWQSGLIMRHTTGLEPLVEREGLVAVYPNAIATQWNDGRAAAAVWGPRDDVAFLRALVAHLVRTGIADPHRIYALGFSNGGMMALRMICEATEVFAAVAVIGASLPAEEYPRCRPNAPTPTLLMNGTADPFVPYEGGQVILRGGVVLSTDQTIAFLRKVNGCADSVQVAALPALDRQDMRVRVYSWTRCSSAAPVVLYRVEGGGHRIPNPDPGIAAFDLVLGRMNHDIDAAAEIWSFFKGRTRSSLFAGK
jgi:polyhydroxybutyrate depolymerase